MQCLHEGVGESDLGPIDGTVAGCFKESQIIGILRIEDEVIDGLLLRISRDQLTWERQFTRTASMAGLTREQRTRREWRAVVCVCSTDHLLSLEGSNWLRRKQISTANNQRLCKQLHRPL